MEISHDLKEKQIFGESFGFSETTVEFWMGQIKELCKGYDQRDTWNMNESGCLFKSVAYKRFSLKKKLKAEDH